MTEAEWISGSDRLKLLYYVLKRASERKLRLYACGCARRIWCLLPPEGKEAVEVAEALADGAASLERVMCTRRLTSKRLRNANIAYAAGKYSYGPSEVDSHAATCSSSVLYKLGGQAALTAVEQAAFATDAPGLGVRIGWKEEAKAQTTLVREIFGNPFRTVPVFDPSWTNSNDSTVVRLARAAYDSMDFTGMPILADALEEAGCANRDILEHLRGPGPHVRGCHVLDAILGRE